MNSQDYFDDSQQQFVNEEWQRAVKQLEKHKNEKQKTRKK